MIRLLILFFSLQLHAEVLEFAIIGDAGQRDPNVFAVKESILRTSVRKLILPGDNLYSGTYEGVWDHWHKADPDKAFELSVVAIGNHTLGYDKEMDYFSKVNPRLFPNKKDYYAVDFGESVVFFVLNSDNRKNISEQMNWLDTHLKETERRFVFIVDHHPVYSVSSFHQWHEVREFNLKLRSIIRAHQKKITALLMGHDHLASVHRVNSIPIIVSGATHEVRDHKTVLDTYTDNAQGLKTPVDLVWSFSEAFPYWVKLSLDTSNPDRSSFQFMSAITDQQRAGRKAGADVDQPQFGLFSLENLSQKKPDLSRVPAKKALEL